MARRDMVAWCECGLSPAPARVHVPSGESSHAFVSSASALSKIA
jgi:hypothetical protein